MTTFTIEQLERWIDRHAIDKKGNKLGTIADVYVDDATGLPEWLAVMTGLFGSRMSFVPLLGAADLGDKVQVAYEKSMVKDSPNVDADGQLTEEEEERLYRHYGLTYKRAISDLDVGPQLAELQEAGSAAHNGEISADAARTRLRKRDAASVEAIDLTSDLDVTEVKNNRERKKP